jgi:hypothetical protein
MACPLTNIVSRNRTQSNRTLSLHPAMQDTTHIDERNGEGILVLWIRKDTHLR